MEIGVGLVAGSHDREELVTFMPMKRPLQPKNLTSPNGRACEICGDDIGLTVDGDFFVACDDCGFPVCRQCYEYERSEGTQQCPQCNTKYKRLKGSPRVEGDEDEEDVDDIEHEFNMAMEPNVNKDLPMPPQTHELQKLVHSHPLHESGPPYNMVKEKEQEGWTGDWKMQQGNIGSTYHPNEANRAMLDETRQPLSRKVAIASGKISPYRMIIAMRQVILMFFLRYRILNPVHDAFGLWVTAVVCEIWFSLSWILEQLPKWFPINRETYVDRLSFRFERQGETSMLSPVDIFVTTEDPRKEFPLVTVNTVLSILAIDYPVEKISCYISDDGASMLTFDSLSETANFAKKWVPFCKKFSVEPRAPEIYFSLKIDNLKDKIQTEFVKERRVMKREYEEFKVRINALAAKSTKVPPEGWIMQDGTPWPGNNIKDHPGMIQAFLGHSAGHGICKNDLPRLFYVSREKRPSFHHNIKAGAINALVRVSGVLSNAPFLLNMDCGHYVNNSKALQEAMCFLMDSQVGNKVCYVQFPQRFDNTDKLDRYANRKTVFFDINMKGLDGIQGPLYIGTGCVFRRRALYGYEPPKGPKRSKITFGLQKKLQKQTNAEDATQQDNEKGLGEMQEPIVSEKDLEKKFGKSHIFLTSSLMEQGGVPPSNPEALLKEAIHVMSCGYEDKTEWGSELGWMYGSVMEDILTGFKMHCRGWRSIYCMPKRTAFKASVPLCLQDRLTQSLQWALGSVQIFFSRHCPLFFGYKGGKLKWLQRIAYINTTTYPFTSLPLLVYSTLPAVCLLSGKFIMPEISTFASLSFIALLVSIFATAMLEQSWSGVSIQEWWRNEQSWVICGISAHLLAVVQGLLNILARSDIKNPIISRKCENEEFSELYAFKWTTLLIPPTTLLIVNLVGVVGGLSIALDGGYETWGVLFGKIFFASWVIVHLYPFLKGLMGRRNRTPTIVVIWSVLLASIFSLLWARIDPFAIETKGPDIKQCGINC